MSSIRERITAGGEKRYQARVRVRGGRPLSATFSSRKAALTWHKAKTDALRAGKVVSELEAERVTLGQAIDAYLDERLEIDHPESAKSRSVKRAQLEWWAAAAGALSLARITAGEISDCRRRLLIEVSPQTTNRYLWALSSVLQACVGWGWLPRNPIRGAVPGLREPKGRLRWLKREEATALLAACAAKDPTLHLIALTALTTGGRQGEIMSLRWEDLRLEASGTPRAYLGTTKNGDRRALNLSAEVVELLQERRRLQRHISGYVFAEAAETGDEPPSFEPLRDRWNAAVQSSGVPNFRFHDLRHTFASWALMEGRATLVELSHLLGHRSMAMVKRYAHLAEEHGVEVSGRVAEYLRSAT